MKNEDSIPLSECYRYGLLSAIHVRAQIKCLTMYMNNAYTADCMVQESDRQILSFRTLFLFLFFFNGSVLTDQVQRVLHTVCAEYQPRSSSAIPGRKVEVPARSGYYCMRKLTLVVHTTVDGTELKLLRSLPSSNLQKRE